MSGDHPHINAPVVARAPKTLLGFTVKCADVASLSMLTALSRTPLSSLDVKDPLCSPERENWTGRWMEAFCIG